jgi:hypothetical protein
MSSFLSRSPIFFVPRGTSGGPELLPMIVTVTLARSAMDLAKRKVIVKRLSAIHDLGAMNVLCTDKTGARAAFLGPERRVARKGVQRCGRRHLLADRCRRFARAWRFG